MIHFLSLVVYYHINKSKKLIMKSLKIIIAAISISLLSSFSLNATDKKPSKVNNELRTKIVSIIGTTIPIHLNQECTATYHLS